MIRSHDVAGTRGSGDPGRIEVRRHGVCNDVAWLATMHPWKKLASIAMVQGPPRERRQDRHRPGFYIPSAPLDAKRFSAAARAHRTIENQLHRVIGVVFRDDLCRFRTCQAPPSMAAIRHTALNLAKQANAKASLKVRRKNGRVVSRLPRSPHQRRRPAPFKRFP